MRLTDIVSNMNLDIYPIIGLILFSSAFGIILWGVIKTPKSLIQHQANLPLEDDFGITSESTNKTNNETKGVSHG